MPSSPLYKEFMAKLEGSMLFRALGEKEKAFLVASYKNADDTQLRKSMDLLEQDNADMKTTVIKNFKTDSQAAADQFAHVSAKYADLKRIALKEENEKDISESSQKADELLEEMSAAKNEPQKKQKKLFGLF